MEKSCFTVEQGSYPGSKRWAIQEATREYGVPRTTLQDHISGRIVHGIKPGPKP